MSGARSAGVAISSSGSVRGVRRPRKGNQPKRPLTNARNPHAHRNVREEDRLLPSPTSREGFIFFELASVV